ncbi:MAG TPA: penicillin acylase family protein [Spirochaetota bacterium]|nr:penicillin acylase family protein [Spirochaetota bacterium]
MKVAKAVVISLIIILTAVFSLEYNLKQQFARSVDDPDGTVTIKGLAERVIVRRDRLGVPYIEAKSEEDLFFAAGYVSASDRLWQMIMMKMVMQGRISEVIGQEGFAIDLFMRTLGAAAAVEDTMKKLDPQSLAVLESYARGVNAYVANHPHLPVEFTLAGYRPEKWQARDSLFVVAMMNFSLSYNYLEELDFLNLAGRVGYDRAAWLFPVYPDEDLPVEEAKKLAPINPRDLNRLAVKAGVLRDGLRRYLSVGLPASNNWALAGSKTKSGRPILCNDTHLELMMPNSWMMVHLKCPTYEAAGVTAPGIPPVILGSNGAVAWGVTMVMADNQDIFVEQIRTEGGEKRYLYKNQWLPLQVRREEFKIRDGKTVVREISSTQHGPLLNDALAEMPFPPEMPMRPLPVRTGYGLALSWALGDGAKSLKGIMDLGRVRTAAELRSAVLNIETAYLNFVYADRDGIGWQVSGKFPTRKKGTGQLPSPGWDGDYGWNGFVPMDKNPHLENPASGFIATANDRTVDKKYQYHLTSSWCPPERVERINQVLGHTRKATAGDMMKLQFDRLSLMARKIQDLLFRGNSAVRVRRAIAAMGEEKAGNAREALEFLKPERFNAVMDENSASAAVLGAFMHCATRELFFDELGPENGMAWESFLSLPLMKYGAPQDHVLGREDSPFWDNVKTKRKETKWDVLAEALSSAILLCEDRMGGNRAKWQWGRLHTYHWKHHVTGSIPVFHGFFNRGPYLAGGDGHTVNVATPAYGKNFDVVEIPAMRLVVDFGLKEPAFLVHVPGQSGNPSSGHYDDMLPFWLNGKNHPLPFGKKAVEEQYEDVLVLKPEKSR